MDEPLRYQVQYTEPAEIEIDAEHSRLADIVSEQYADRWQDSLLEKIDSLETVSKVYRAVKTAATSSPSPPSRTQSVLYQPATAGFVHWLLRF